MNMAQANAFSDIERLLDIGIALSSEKNSDKLFEMVLDAAMDITGCDGGTLYVTGDDTLRFKIIITKSLGLRKGIAGEPVDLPPIPLTAPNVSSRAALTKKPINIANVYDCTEHDFSGTKKYDEINGYKTVSLLAVPMEDDRGDVIGVLQLINALGKDGAVIPFAREYERVVFSLSSQAAICLTNRNYAAEVMELLDSFVRVMAAAIDERSPYNAHHTRNMVDYAGRFIAYLNDSGEETFTNERTRQFLMSVWLHDIGKLVVPLEIMDKPGSLTAQERKIMESHVVMTRKLLDEMSFPKQFRSVSVWASTHHEMLSGTGYPDGLADDEIPTETRILTILDIFDALTADDRPYKPAMPVDRAFAILTEMADNGQLDARLVKLFIDSMADDAGES